MKTTVRKNNPSYISLLKFWEKHCCLDKWHIDWLKQNIEIIKPLPKGEIVYVEGERQKSIFFVCRGALARIVYDTNQNMHILSIALQEMALMSTTHLFSSTPSSGNITALHPNTRIIKIPYSSIINYIHEVPEISTLFNILNNKEKKQLFQLRYLSSIKNPIDRYLYFNDNLKELKNSITNIQAAQLLGISIATIIRAQKMEKLPKVPKKSVSRE